MLSNASPPPPQVAAIDDTMVDLPHTKATSLEAARTPKDNKGRLLKLVVTNFKSYSSTQTIGPFEHNFICIIGPNGAGKSNLMDAISFVLGIHSMHLRSTSLKDLIHRPSSPTIPQPTSASVEAHYLQPNGDLVIFKRVIDTAAASEEYNTSSTPTPTSSSYYINDIKMSWKEYTAEWEKENILIKARNFLVFQGDVEALANKSPAQLTSLIEDVSGSSLLQEEWSTLKGQLQEAQVQSNDAFSKRRTLSSELKAVEEQKQDVLEWQNVSAELCQHILKYSKQKLQTSSMQKSALAKGIEELSSSLAFLLSLSQQAGDEGMLREKRVEMALRTKEILDLERSLAAAQQNLLLSLEPKIRSSSSFLEMTKQRKQRIEESQKRETDAIVELERNVTDLFAQSETLENERNLLQQSLLKKIEQKHQEGLSILEKASFSKEAFLREYKETLREAKLLAPEDRLKLESLNTKDVINRTKKEASESHLRSLKLALEGISKRRNQLEARVERLQAKQNTSERQRLLSQIAHHQERQETNKEKARMLGMQISSITDQLLLAGEQRGELERSSLLLKQLERLEALMGGKMIYGRLSSLVKARDVSWEPCVRNLLGHHYDSIVVRDHQVAKRAIECLRELSLGSATFLPLDTLKVSYGSGGFSGFGDNNSNNNDGPVKNAIKSLSFHPEIERAVTFVVGSETLLSPTLKEVLKLQAKRKVVCLDGSIQHFNGLVSGLLRPPPTSNAAKGQQPKALLSPAAIKDLHLQRDNLQKQEAQILEEQRMADPTIDWLERLQQLQREDDNILAEMNTIHSLLASSAAEEEHLSGELEVEERKMENEVDGHSLKEEISLLEERIAVAESSLFSSLSQKLNVEDVQRFVVDCYICDDCIAGYGGGGGVDSGVGGIIGKNNSNNSNTLSTSRLDELNLLLKRIKDQITFLNRQKETKSIILQDYKAKSLPDISSLEHQLAEDGKLLVAEQQNLQRMQDRHSGLQDHLRMCRIEEEELRQQRDARKVEIKSVRGEICAKRSYLDRLEVEEEEIRRKCHHEQIPLTPTFLNDGIYEVGVGGYCGVSGCVNGSCNGCTTNNTGNTVYPGSEESWAKEEERMRRRLDQLAGSLRPMERLQEAGQRIRGDLERLEGQRGELRSLRERFGAVKSRRAALFMHAFNGILLSLDPIYKALTGGGGGAFLSLVPLLAGGGGADEDEPYLQGTTFHAMPPMKRFLEMDQLSGGERSMAALALLFSIHSVRPSPFFILDEVDAALDLQNIRRMVGYLRSRKDDCQFLMISLKRELYESSDSLVGIYVDVADGVGCVDDDDDNGNTTTTNKTKTTTSRTLLLDLTVYEE